jgi:hypothetical protein
MDEIKLDFAKICGLNTEHLNNSVATRSGFV